MLINECTKWGNLFVNKYFFIFNRVKKVEFKKRGVEKVGISVKIFFFNLEKIEARVEI